MKYSIVALLLTSTPALAHSGSDIHFHYPEAMAALAGVAVYGLVSFLRRNHQ